MPAFEQINTDKHQLLIWKIEEPIEFFSKGLSLNLQESQEYSYINTENRKLEWMATRYTQRQLVEDQLIKDGFGKPHLATKNGAISLSHCKGYTAVLYSKQKHNGIDIEPIHEKIIRIASKFMSEQEFEFIDSKNKEAHLIACWTIKEAVYKYYGKKSLRFKEHIKIQAFKFGVSDAEVHLIHQDATEKLSVNIIWNDSFVVSYL